MLIETEVRTELHECPKCGKKALVARGDRFHCLWCNFTRDVSEPEPDGSFLVIVIAAILLIGLVLSTPRKPVCVNGQINGQCFSDTRQPAQLYR